MDSPRYTVIVPMARYRADEPALVKAHGLIAREFKTSKLYVIEDVFGALAKSPHCSFAHVKTLVLSPSITRDYTGCDSPRQEIEQRSKKKGHRANYES